jgi:hypothetical protein
MVSISTAFKTDSCLEEYRMYHDTFPQGIAPNLRGGVLFFIELFSNVTLTLSYFLCANLTPLQEALLTYVFDTPAVNKREKQARRQRGFIVDILLNT